MRNPEHDARSGLRIDGSVQIVDGSREPQRAGDV